MQRRQERVQEKIRDEVLNIRWLHHCAWAVPEFLLGYRPMGALPSSRHQGRATVGLKRSPLFWSNAPIASLWLVMAGGQTRAWPAFSSELLFPVSLFLGARGLGALRTLLA